MAVAAPGLQQTELQGMELGGVIKMSRGLGMAFAIECSNQDQWEFLWDAVCETEQALTDNMGVLTLSFGFHAY